MDVVVVCISCVVLLFIFHRISPPWQLMFLSTLFLVYVLTDLFSSSLSVFNDGNGLHFLGQRLLSLSLSILQWCVLFVIFSSLSILLLPLFPPFFFLLLQICNSCDLLVDSHSTVSPSPLSLISTNSSIPLSIMSRTSGSGPLTFNG